MRTDFETLKQLASYTINLLKERGLIDFDITKRIELIELLAQEYNVGLVTDEDIKEEAIEEVEEKMGHMNLPEDITETEMYNHARKEIIKSFNGENIAGLYLIESLHEIGKRMNKFFGDCPIIDDVYASDEDLESSIKTIVRSFSVKRG